MSTSDHGLLTPGAHRAAGRVDDAALVSAMVRVEVAWLHALAEVSAVERADAHAVADAVAEVRIDVPGLSAAAESAGNPVAPLVDTLREAVAERPGAAALHRGLTSQDVLDTALILLARDALLAVRDSLTDTGRALAALARDHRRDVMVGRTLTQHAVPITFGVKAARWLSGVIDAAETVDAALSDLPVQCGGAAGTLALVGERTADPVAAARAFAHELGLVWPGTPWHTNRAPITRLGTALVGTCDALGALASDVALLSRPEIGEVHEGATPGRGRSSTMPHKRNPVLAVLVRSAAMQAPMLGAQLHSAAGQMADERPDGAWHSEWPALHRLLELTVIAASQGAELAAHLEVDTAAMAERAGAAAAELLAERDGPDGGDTPGDPATYLGAADQFIDVVLERMCVLERRHG